ncbi:MAG: CotH kinase family protein [Ruminococcus sp.]|nr:CotH kinase family protein [Ruminococcus sp.]
MEKELKRMIAGLVTAGIAAAISLPAARTDVKAAAEGVLINEICAKNTAYPAPDGGMYDWIELYNSSSSAVDISGWGLSDNEAKPFRFTFPDGASIPALGRIMVFCDSRIPAIDGSYTASFGLSTAGETVTLTRSDGSTADSASFGPMAADTSYGRIPDGSDTFAVMSSMTPAAENRADGAQISVEAPVLSLESGFYDGEQQLTISAAPGLTIYYTTDGSTPDASSAPYTGSIALRDNSSEQNVLSARTDIVPRVQTMWGMSAATAPASPVDKANVIRAAAVDSEGNVSTPVTGTYFINYQGKADYYKNMKVISIVTDSDNLFGYENGIYVLGKVHDDWRNGSEYDQSTPSYFMPANYTQKGREWEREASMQLFEDGKLALSQNIGMRIHGGATRSSEQKSFNIYARKEYGAEAVEYDLFSSNAVSEAGKIIDKFDSFVLRNGGNDASYSRWRDKLNQTLSSGRDFLTQSMESAVVFIDGEYWGQYEITEKLSDDFVHDHFDIPKKNVCIIKNQELDEGDAEGFDEFEQLWSWVRSGGFSDDAAYAELAEKVDMQSLADYLSAELYINNCDWGDNNMALWKSMVTDETNEYADGRWRFIMYDTEYSTGLYGQCGADDDSFSKLMKADCFLSDLFRAALQNEQFRSQFVNSLALSQ